MEIKNYLFKNIYNNHKENIAKKVIKRNKKDSFIKDNIFNKKKESLTSIFTHQYTKKNKFFLNNKTNSSYNMNSSSNFNSNYQSQSSDKKHLTQKKIAKGLNSNYRNLSQTNKMSLNNKKKILSSTSNTTATSLITNQINNINKCITDRNIEDNKNLNINKNFCHASQFFIKNKTIFNNRDLKDSSIVMNKKFYGINKKENIGNNTGKNVLKNKIQKKGSKYQLNYIDKNINNIMDENILFKKKINNNKNSTLKINNNKLKSQNQIMNLNENKSKINNNALNIKKLNLSNLPISFLDGKMFQGIINVNGNNNIDSYTKKECITDRTNYNYISNINSHQKNKEIISEQFNNINNNYIITNIINNIKLNNKKIKKKKISRNKSIKLSEKENDIYNTNLTSFNLIFKNTNIKNYPSSLRIKTIDLSKINNKMPSIDYNTSYNKKSIYESKNINKKLFDVNVNNINLKKRKISNKRKNNCNIKIKKKGKNYKRLMDMPLKLTKKHILPKEKKYNIDMNFTSNTVGFDKLNLLTFNFNQKTDNINKRKLSQANVYNRYQSIFQLFNSKKNSTNETKKNSNTKIESFNNIIKTNFVHNIPKNSKKNSKYINSLSTYDFNNKEKELLKISNTSIRNENKNILNNSNNYKLNRKLIKKYYSNSPLDINCLLKKGNSKKNNDKNLHSKSRNISRNFKNSYLGFLNNETKTTFSKFKTTRSNRSKSKKNDKNNQNEITDKPKNRVKNLSVGINNINTSENNKLDDLNKEKDKSKHISFSNIFYTEKNNNFKNNQIEDSNEVKKISINRKSNNNLNQNIQNICSTITVKEKDKSRNQSDFSKKSRNISIPINSLKNKTVIKEDNNKKEKRKNSLIIDEYFDEILYSLLKEESQFISKKLINHIYLIKEENEISPEMRGMVVDWLLEVHQIFHFQEKCLFTTIQIIDKYLSKINIKIEQFQLLALTALNIASKQEEVEYPILDNFITISKNTLTKKEMIYMENKVLSAIDYEILSPTILDFFQIYAFICNLNPVEISQGLYIMNILLIDINMLKYKNSILAFAVLKIIAKEKSIKKLFLFVKEISKNAYKINGNKNNEAQILLEELNKENNDNDLITEIKHLFRTILKTHYYNAKNKFNNQKFYAVSSYTSI